MSSGRWWYFSVERRPAKVNKELVSCVMALNVIPVTEKISNNRARHLQDILLGFLRMMKPYIDHADNIYRIDSNPHRRISLRLLSDYWISTNIRVTCT